PAPQPVGRKLPWLDHGWCAQRPPGIRPAHVPCAQTAGGTPVFILPTRGRPWRSVASTRELSIQPQVCRSLKVVSVPSTTVSRKFVGVPLSRAAWFPFGDR